MPYLSYIIFFIIIFAFQTSALHSLIPGETMPDLALLSAFYFGLKMKDHSGVFTATFIGFIQDCLSGGILGINTLSKGLTGFFTTFLKGFIPMGNILPIGICIAIVSVSDGILFYLITSLFTKNDISFDSLFRSLPVFIFLNLLSAPFLFSIIRKLDGPLGKKPQTTISLN
jgi:rod shape-determining protein MreD